jgi:hypothetical protein
MELLHEAPRFLASSIFRPEDERLLHVVLLFILMDLYLFVYPCDLC